MAAQWTLNEAVATLPPPAGRRLNGDSMCAQQAGVGCLAGMEQRGQVGLRRPRLDGPARAGPHIGSRGRIEFLFSVVLYAGSRAMVIGDLDPVQAPREAFRFTPHADRDATR